MINIDDFFDLVERNEAAKVRELINNGFDTNAKNKFGSSIVHLAVHENLIAMVKLFIDAGVNLDMQNKDGATGLHYVAESNQLELAELFTAEQRRLIGSG